MTSLTTDQIIALVVLIAKTEPDQLTCGDCFGQIGEFADLALEGRELSAGLQLIQRHLEQCPCCKDEYESLLKALGEMEANANSAGY
jgi:hypothetical protein